MLPQGRSHCCSQQKGWKGGGTDALNPQENPGGKPNPDVDGEQSCLRQGERGRRLPVAHLHSSFRSNGFSSFGSSFKSDRDSKAERQRDSDRHTDTQKMGGEERKVNLLPLGQPETLVHQTSTDTGQPAHLESDGRRFKPRSQLCGPGWMTLLL